MLGRRHNGSVKFNLTWGKKYQISRQKFEKIKKGEGGGAGERDLVPCVNKP